MQSAGAVPAKSEGAREKNSSLDAEVVVRHLVHELRQPLSTIESIAYYLALVTSQSDDRVQRQLEKMQQVIQQANWILSDSIHFLQATPPSAEIVELDELISDSVSEAVYGGQNWVDLELSTEPTLVRLDAEQGCHLLRNVLFFFRQICGHDSRIRLRTSTANGWVQVELQAGSVDVPVKDLDSMFEPFNPHLPAGSGLALASVRRIAEVHGGRTEFHSGDDGGLQLIVAFPLAE